MEFLHNSIYNGIFINLFLFSFDLQLFCQHPKSLFHLCKYLNYFFLFVLPTKRILHLLMIYDVTARYSVSSLQTLVLIQSCICYVVLTL